jgi:leucine-rich repeat protein SHOC2
LQPFLDREELQAGDYLAPQIEGAINAASVHVTIFSPTYAESKWCLDELVLILKSKVSVIPVFHNVKPSELRWTGRYAQALNNHEQKRRYDPQTLESWRKALFDVSSLIGFELEAYNGLELKLFLSLLSI